MFPGSIVKPGFNPLAAQTPTILYNLFSWGANTYGQLALGNTTLYNSPKQVGSSSDWSITNSNGQSQHFLAVKTDGTLWSWGRNNVGQLGLGTSGNYASKSSPSQVGALTNWLSVAAGYNCSFAIKTNGTLWSWGGDGNAFGVLGLGNTTQYSSPKQVGSGATWRSVVSGFRMSMATKTDGTLWVWGNNYFGGLGLGSSSNYNILSPVQLGSLTNWLKLSAGYGSNFAIKTDGTLWAWGFNASVGQLGLNNTTYKYVSPIQVGALTNWLNIQTGGQSLGYSLAAKTDGTLWSWGRNQDGQLGLGNTTDYSSPKQIGALTAWSLTECGKTSSFAIKTNGTLWSWGDNGYGQLGLGNTTSYSSPKQIGASSTWLSVACAIDATNALG